MPPFDPLRSTRLCRAPAEAGGPLPRDPDFETPEAVHEYLLEVTRRAYLQDDEDAFVARFLLPQVIITVQETRAVETPEEVRAIFRANRTRFLQQGVTDIVRVCIAARFVTPDKVQATHVTYLLQGTRLVTAPYPNTGELVRRNGVWLISSSQYGSDDPAWERFNPKQNAPARIDRTDPALGGHPTKDDRKDTQ